MSHHLDSPLARTDSRLDITDQYVFPGDTGTTLVMNVNSSLSGDRRAFGFHPEARYEFKIHLDDAPYEGLTYRLAFGERGADGGQSYTVNELAGEEAVEDAATGSLVAQGRTGGEVSAGVRVWAGTAADPFSLDFALLGAVSAAVRNGTAIDTGDWRPQDAANTFAGTTVESIVLELPDTGPQLRTGSRIAVWSVTKLATDDGGWRQINRAGLPMIWPIFRPDDSAYASEANTIQPAQDRAKDGERFAALIEDVTAATGTADPRSYGETLAQRLLPDLLPYRVGSPAGFGFSGINGRALGDNAPEVMFSLVTNSAVSTGLPPKHNAGTHSARFPYVVPASGEA
jgi:hypothetical protein